MLSPERFSKLFVSNSAQHVFILHLASEFRVADYAVKALL